MRLEITPAKISGNLLILISFFFFGCMSPQKTREIVINSGFDISRNDSTLLFACYLEKNNGVSIYEMSLTDSVPKLIVKCTSENSYYDPKYLKDKKQIAFIRVRKSNLNDRTVCIANLDGSNIRELTFGNEIIQGIRPSQYYDSTILYSKASEVSRGSIVGRTQPHDFNIYSLNYYTKTSSHVTDFMGVYNMNKFSEVDSGLLVVGMAPHGLFFIKRDQPEKKYGFIPEDDPRGDSALYYQPFYSKQCNCIGFTAPYELYTMDINTKKSRRIFRNDEGPIDDFCFFNTKKKILFLREYDTQFLVKDLETGEIEAVKLEL